MKEHMYMYTADHSVHVYEIILTYMHMYMLQHLHVHVCDVHCVRTPKLHVHVQTSRKEFGKI